MQVRKQILQGLTCVMFLSGTAAAQVKQDTVSLDVDQLFQLVIKNNPTLKVAKESIKVAEQATQVAKNNQLPSANVSTSAMYLGDVDIFSTNFKTHNKQDMPNFGHAIAVEANQLIWKGGQVRETIKLSQLQEAVASLQFNSTEQQARLSALGYYLDLYKLQNQSRVYQQNIGLAEVRLKNINSFFNQGMVTRNDVIRGELQIVIIFSFLEDYKLYDGLVEHPK